MHQLDEVELGAAQRLQALSVELESMERDLDRVKEEALHDREELESQKKVAAHERKRHAEAIRDIWRVCFLRAACHLMSMCATLAHKGH